ncbi:hypothetical protein ACJX0J_038274, partial [Zea mays]
SWSGTIKVWSMPQITRVATLKGHKERATDVAFSPADGFLATASAYDARPMMRGYFTKLVEYCIRYGYSSNTSGYVSGETAKLWEPDGSLLMSFDGHLDRLGRLAFHPSGKYLGTASFDKTWRSPGHSRSVYGVSFHPDGSLAASCGLDAYARVWDLRSGRLFFTYMGHVKPVGYFFFLLHHGTLEVPSQNFVWGVNFSPNGYLVATGSEDNFCRIWDLRKNLISHVKLEPQEGYYLATSSYDTKATLWSARDYKAIKSLVGHESKVTSLDISEGKILHRFLCPCAHISSIHSETFFRSN